MIGPVRLSAQDRSVPATGPDRTETEPGLTIPVHCQGVCGIRYEHVLKPPIHLPDVSHRTYNLQTYLTP